MWDVAGNEVIVFRGMLKRLAHLHEFTGDPYEGVLGGSWFNLSPYQENWDLFAAHTRARRELAAGLGRLLLLRLTPECWGQTTTKAHLVSLGLPAQEVDLID